MTPESGDTWIRRCRPLLGTFVEVAVPPDNAEAIGHAFDAIAHVHSLMSFHDEASDLARLRRAPPGAMVRVDPETIVVLRASVALNMRSGGIFDVTVGRHLVADGFLPCPPGCEPSEYSGTSADLIIIDDEHVRCERPMFIDLGGIAKGHAVDRGIEALIARGAKHGIVNAGGDVRVLGVLQQPIHLRGADGCIDGLIMLADGAVASSSHDPAITQGAPSPHRGGDGRSLWLKQAVSVVAPTCMIADAMTKVAIADLVLAKEMLTDFGGAVIGRASMALAA